MIDFCEVLEYNGKEASPIESANTPSRLRRDSDLRKGTRGTPLTP